MGKRVSLDYSFTFPFIDDQKIENFKSQAAAGLKTLVDGNGAGNDFLGWRSLPSDMLDSAEFKEIKAIGEKIYSDGDLLICVGIGGSYLGAKAVTEALLPPFHNMYEKDRRKGPRVLFAGQNISGSWLESILEEIEISDSVYVNVISKSGTTTEPGIAFRNIKALMEKKYGEAASERIIGTTDKARGALKKLAGEKGYKTFVIPDDVGGRFSVLTPVGLIPIAAAGIDIDQLLQGAKDASEFCKDPDYTKNPALMYAIVRNLLLAEGYSTEILVNYEPTLHYISEWWKQLYGESEGKDGKGIFTASVDFTSDLHSMGQWIQEGPRYIFETLLHIETPLSKASVVSDAADLDGLEYLAGKSFDDINKQAEKGTLIAHYEGKVPNMIFNIPELNAYYLGQLLYIFEFGCGISGYILGVNPFNQPGVESYKKNMFALLNKPGDQHKQNRAELDKKMESLPSGKIV